jgi:hypothetical protein
MKTNRIMWGVVSLVVLITVAVSFGAFESSGREDGLQQPEITPTVTPWPVEKDTRDLSKYASVEYTKAPEDLSASRVLANKRYDGQGRWVVESVNPYTGGIGRIRDREPSPLFPTDESTLIVVGEVVKVIAFLSNDRKCVYTEFTIRVDEVLKRSDAEKADLKKVTADREGGVVIYPGDQKVMYQDSDIGLPRLGSKYLLFLKKDDGSPNYAIIRSYDITGARVVQVENIPSFEEFKDLDKTVFIEKVRNKITRPPN